MTLPINKYLLFLAIFYFITACNSHHKEYYENGVLKKECYVEKDRSSICNFYYDTGKLMEFNQQSEDKKSKFIKAYYPNEILKLETKIVNDSILFSKSYDLAGMLLKECVQANHCRYYEYYKNKKLFRINYTKKLVNDTSGVLQEDSVITYSIHTGKKLLKKIALPMYKSVVVTEFSEDGRTNKIDTILDENILKLILNKLLKNDTLQVQYQPE